MRCEAGLNQQFEVMMQAFSLGITGVRSIRSYCNEHACIPKTLHVRLGTFEFF